MLAGRAGEKPALTRFTVRYSTIYNRSTLVSVDGFICSLRSEYNFYYRKAKGYMDKNLILKMVNYCGNLKSIKVSKIDDIYRID
jgi:hypothetical protein